MTPPAPSGPGPADPASSGPDPEDADPEDANPSLFRERTELAWHRTGIAFAAIGGMLLKTAPVVGLLVLAGSVPIFVIGRTARRGDRAGDPRPRRRRSLLLISVAVTIVSLTALALALFDGGHPLPPF